MEYGNMPLVLTIYRAYDEFIQQLLMGILIYKDARDSFPKGVLYDKEN